LKKFEDILARCIDDIDTGVSTIEDCLDRYPSMRNRLEPLLRIAAAIPETPHTEPSLAFKTSAPARLMDQIHDKHDVAKWPRSGYENSAKSMPRRARLRMASATAAIALVLFALAGGVAYASQDSVPGDALYPVKLGTEQLRMLLPGEDSAKAKLALSFARRRVGEIVVLAETGRTQHMALAVEKYEDAVIVVCARVEKMSDKGVAVSDVLALIAETTERHLSALDTIYDIVPLQTRPVVVRAREVSWAGYLHALHIEGQPTVVELPERQAGRTGSFGVVLPPGAEIEVTTYEGFEIGRIGEFRVVLHPDVEIGVTTFGTAKLQMEVIQISPPPGHELIWLGPDQTLPWPPSEDDGASIRLDPEQTITWPPSEDDGGSIRLYPEQTITWPPSEDDGGSIRLYPEQTITWPPSEDDGASIRLDPEQTITWPPSEDDGASIRLDPEQTITWPLPRDEDLVVEHTPEDDEQYIAHESDLSRLNDSKKEVDYED